MRPWTIIWKIDSKSKDLLKLGHITMPRELIEDTVPFKAAVLISSRKHDSCATGEYCMTCEQQSRSEQRGRTEGSEVLT